MQASLLQPILQRKGIEKGYATDLVTNIGKLLPKETADGDTYTLQLQNTF